MSFAWLPLGVLAALAAPIAPAAPMPPRPALCILEQNGVTAFAGRCRLHPAADWGFSLGSGGAGPLLPGLTTLSVSPLRPSLAEVRGLTVQGVNSRWGRAVRSSVDPACWQGLDFAVCTY